MALLQLAPQAVFHAHCCAFLEKTADAAKLLSDIFGAAGDTTQQAVQVVHRSAVFVLMVMPAASSCDVHSMAASMLQPL